MLKLQVYHNSHDSFFRKPFGAVPCGTTIRLRVEIRSEIPVTLCQLRLWEKGAVERLLAMDLLQSEKEEGSHRRYLQWITGPKRARFGLVLFSSAMRRTGFLLRQ